MKEIASGGRRLLFVCGLSMFLVSIGTYLPLTGKLNQVLEESRRLSESVDEETFENKTVADRVVETFERHKDNDGRFAKGTLSRKPDSFFRTFQQAVDNENLKDRCERYGFSMTHPTNNSLLPRVPRKIFYGSLVADEPLELMDIVATESYGIFEGMVLVESNRTQHFHHRKILRANDDKQVQKIITMFGVRKVQIRKYVNEDSNSLDLVRENQQRQEILKGWKELGMKGADVGYIGDLDETFTRDFLRAVQLCPYVEALDYDTHHCMNHNARIIGSTQVFESSPECVTHERSWFHPDMVIGQCIEEIGDKTMNVIAPRDGYRREAGYGRDCESHEKSFYKIEGNKYPLWNAGDFRMACGGRMYEMNGANRQNRSKYSAFHLHNFFADFNTTRRKYLTYGHPNHLAMTARLEDIEGDLKLLYRCSMNLTDAPLNHESFPNDQRYQRVVGGIKSVLPPWPIYFTDPEYRERKHSALQKKVWEDERIRQSRMSPHERAIERMWQEAQEAKRVIHDRETKIKALKEKHQINDP